MWVGSNYSCARVSSISIGSAGGGIVEFGWVLGYSLATNSWHANPGAFVAWAPPGGTSHYAWIGSVAKNDYGDFELSDVNENGWYRTYYNGDFKVTKNAGFTFGYAVTNGERKSTNDAGKAKFHYLLEHHPGNGWSRWDNARLYGDNDPDFHFVRVDASDTNVIRD